jgi:hypothetical protein
MAQLRSAMFVALTRGIINFNDRICCLGGIAGSNQFDTVVIVDVEREFQTLLGGHADLLPPDVKPEVLERVIGILVENHAGAFPLWLAPVQIVVMNISEAQADYAESVAKKLRDAGLRGPLRRRLETTWQGLSEREVVVLSPACGEALLRGSLEVGLTPEGPVTSAAAWLALMAGASGAAFGAVVAWVRARFS